MQTVEKAKARTGGSRSVPPKPSTVVKFTPAMRGSARRAAGQPTPPKPAASIDETLPLDDSPSALEQQKRIALLSHSMWVSCVKGWWEVMTPHGTEDDQDSEPGARGFIIKEQYLDLSVRLQKCVQRDFSYPQACLKAESDWEIEFIDQPSCSPSPTKPGNDSTAIYDDSQPKERFGFSSFTDFLFETAQEFYPYVCPPVYLFIVNALMIQISSGSFLRSSLFKDVRDVKFLPELFFSTLHSREEPPDSLSFQLWYHSHFSDQKGLIATVLQMMFAVFPNDVRLVDIWTEPIDSTYTKSVIEAIKRMDESLRKVEPVPTSVVESVFERTSLKIAVQTKPDKEQCVTERKPQVPVQTYRSQPQQDGIQLEETPMLDPRIYSNRIEFRRIIKLPLLGQSYTHKLPPHAPPPDSHTPADTTISTIMQPINSHLRTATRESDSQTHSQLDMGMDRPVSAPGSPNQKGGRSDRENTEKRILLQKSPQRNGINDTQTGSGSQRQASSPEGRGGSAGPVQGRYRREDIKFAGLPKEWRRGRFQKPLPADPLDMRGIINRKSQHELAMARELHAALTIRETLETAEKIQLRHKSLPVQSRRSAQISAHVERRPVGVVGEGSVTLSAKASEGNSVVEKESLAEAVEDGIKVDGRALSPGKGPVRTSENQSPFPSRMSNVSSPPPMSAVTYKESIQPGKAEGSKVTAVYDFHNYAHLLLPDHMPERMEYDDPMEFLYALNILKYQYNKAHESEFLSVISSRNVYESRRDELGGSISHEEWKQFIARVERLARLRNRRRRLRRARRRRLGIPPKQRKPALGELPKPNLKKNLLWKSVFLPKSQSKSRTCSVPPHPPSKPPPHKPSRLLHPHGIHTQRFQ